MEARGQTAGFDQLVDALRNHWILIPMFTLLAAGAAYGVSKLQPERYDATAKLLFRTASYSQEDVLGTNTPTSTGVNNDPVRQAATNVSLVELPIVAARTSQAFGGRPTAQRISEMITASADGQSDVVSVTAADSEPRRAKRVANTFTREFVAFRAETDRSKLARAKRLAEREYSQLSPAEATGPRGEALSSAAERLGVLASLQTGNAELVQPARVPRSPSSPKPLRNGVLGAVLGLMIGIGLALLIERLKRRRRDGEGAALDPTFSVPAIESAPEAATPSQGNGVPDPQGNGAGDAVRFATESTALQTVVSALRRSSASGNIDSVVVTADGSEERASTVSWSLASAVADSSSVVIVEANLSAPSLARHHGMAVAPGVVEVLTDQVSWRQAIQSMAGTDDGESAGRTIDLLVCGKTPPNPVELVESAQMGYLLASLSGYYDVLIIDTDTATFPLLRRVHGAIVVVRTGDAAGVPAADRASQWE